MTMWATKASDVLPSAGTPVGTLLPPTPSIVEDTFTHNLPRVVDLSVTSYSIRKDGVVMYHVDVQSSTGTYTIRRRYTDFRALYLKLASDMPMEQAADEVMTSRTSLISRFTTAGSTLPSLPSAGVWSFLRKYDTKVLEKRRERFQDILDAAASHPIARASDAFQNFLSVAPEAVDEHRASYTSLRDYSVPTDNMVYLRQRKKAAGRKRLGSEGTSETSMIQPTSTSIRVV
ncbi:hypothetical protein H257_13918 [Aphanomyces astaci]|uniref:PX domain-containing protein n=2 Tax=Aphanomyces astaci TaxID=112090 RepID=W4FV48_APHAT|nr:hypothetical protein H257_13918 [Aphanomyces astaci]ETV70528.1 hypothetical protein H257_13918 [Aphanomyces astaci]RQM20928.1 hypothetical protein B5M09_007397 [Aphanomyces astaci]|eukprot:XP_009839911.1 hypothetical protein H257_13918 [Aphanomyces astaci]